MGVNNYLKDAFANAKVKFVNETFEYLDRIHASGVFKCKSNFPQINDAEFSLKKGNRCFTYDTTAKIIPGRALINNGEAYGLFKEFVLANETRTIKVAHVSTASFILGNPISINGEIHELEESFLISKKKYCRLLLPKENNLDKNHKAYIESERFVTNNTVHLLGLMEFMCADNLFHVFDYEKNGKAYLVIDSMSPIKYSSFETAIAAIVYSIGFITGHAPRNETHILQSDSNEFKKLTGFKYRRVEDSIWSNMEVVSPLLLSQAQKSKVMSGHVGLHSISQMATLAFLDKRFLRALKIICEGNTYPLEIRASCYSVALETIKNIILESDGEKVNPFKDKTTAKATIKNLVKELNKVPDEKFNSKEAIVKKLEQLNQVTNKDSFKTAFKSFGIILTQSDEEALLLRNDFLHGRLPFENESEYMHKQELRYTTYKLHFLLSLLIMKGAEFSGYIINSPKLFSLISPDGKEVKEPAFWKI